MFTRRQFLKALGVLGGVVLAPLHGLERARASSLSAALPPEQGELYAGFLLLPEGAAVPEWVQPPRRGIPRMCGVGVGEGGDAHGAVTRFYDTADDLARGVGFPVYSFSRLPEGLRPGGAFVVGHETGEEFGASLGFEAYNSESDIWECRVSLWAQPDFPRPFPLWSGGPVKPGAPSVVLEKVGHLPAPGVMVTTQTGHAFHWIMKDVFYTLAVEPRLSSQAIRALVDGLAPIN